MHDASRDTELTGCVQVAFAPSHGFVRATQESNEGGSYPLHQSRQS